ncbi:M1 family aminopeptidase [uncultured Chitinophaga sp.]|uniref:M1 family aminopeptidase n=1 Tax=uncultured Chitinophaga sp. TaxID=339340 RepID=UPI0025FE9A32|nr:M1 family aminopeptidase [uncultured Chitinophaga sp.]
MLSFELKYYWSQLTFKLAGLLFFVLGCVCVHGGFGGPDVHSNGPYVISVVLGLLSLFTIFVSIVFCAVVVLRDSTWKMEEVLYATAIRRSAYFVTRFSGLLLAAFVVMVLALAGMMLGSSMMDNNGPFRVCWHLHPLFVFALPNVLFTCAVIFCTAVLTRSTKAVYAAGVLLFILYLTSSILGNSPMMAGSALKTDHASLLPYLTDPFALSVLFGETRQWTDVQRNSEVLPLNGILLWNRLLWGGVSALLLLVTYRIFRFRLAEKLRQKLPGTVIRDIIPYQRFAVKPRFLYSFTSQLKLEVRSVFLHIPFVLLLVLWVFLYGVELYEGVFRGPYGITFYPLTGILVEELRTVRPAMLLIIFYTAEVLARERASNMQGIIYSTPVSNGVMWSAKSCSLFLLVFTLVTLNVMMGVVLQLANNTAQMDVAAYLSLYYYSALPLCLYVLLAIFIQSLIPNKYLAMLCNLIIAGIIIFSKKIGIEHYLLRFATVPEMQYSDFNGFGHYAKAFNWYMLYWTLLSVALSLLGISIWIKERKIPISKWLFPLLVAWMVTGAFIFYKSNIEGDYKSRKAAEEWQLQYEGKYKSLENQPQPTIKAVATKVDLYPSENRYSVSGSYRIMNESAVVIHSLWISIDPEVTTAVMEGCTMQQEDGKFRQYRYKLPKPLQPGEETILKFNMQTVRSGFTPFNSEHAVVSNGTYIELEKYLPHIGYNNRYENGDKVARRKFGLPAQTEKIDSLYHFIDYETVVSTEGDQQVVTVGDLQGSWKKDGRRYYHYKTASPVRFMLALSSARYAVKSEWYNGVALTIYHHPNQTKNLAGMMMAMKDALDYGDSQYSRYPYRHYRLVAIPQYRGAATAYPGVVFSGERINFLGNYSDSSTVNQAYAITAHETAHQWFAYLLGPENGAGAAFLTESLAQYTEAMVLEKRFGKDKVGKHLLTDNQLYFGMRTADELPLAYTYNQAYVHYQKGTVVMYALKEAFGEDTLNGVLRQLLAQHAYPHIKANPDALVQMLTAKANPWQQKVVHEELQRVIIYSAGARLLSCKPVGGQQFKATIALSVRKRDIRTGKELVPDDNLEIALYAGGERCYLKKHQVTSTETVLDLVLSRSVDAVEIDPYGYILNDKRF